MKEQCTSEVKKKNALHFMCISSFECRLLCCICVSVCCSRHYFVLLCNMEPLEVFMGYYNKLVPHIYIPEPAVMEVNMMFLIIDFCGQCVLFCFVSCH
jgi:hypothetical protein